MKPIAIVGPTACGKTRRAVDVASAFNGEIISADSRQVYRGMSIGTGKDLEEYGQIPYHIIDVCDAGEKYNLHDYLRDFKLAFDDISARNKLPVICGGSGMYVENALKGVALPDVPENPQLRKSLEGKSLNDLAEILAGFKALHNTTDIDTAKRAIRAIEIENFYVNNPHLAAKASYAGATPIDCIVIGIDIPREQRRKRISQRLDARLNQGMIQEVEGLLNSGIAPDNLIYYGLEYKFLTLFVTGKISFDEMRSNLEIAIHQFAKRQMTWFRGMEKRGTQIHWIPFDLSAEDFLQRVKSLI